MQYVRLSLHTTAALPVADYLKAQMIAFDTDIHAVAGLLKRYFRELPDPLFTEELYVSFVQGLGEEETQTEDKTGEKSCRSVSQRDQNTGSSSQGL